MARDRGGPDEGARAPGLAARLRGVLRLGGAPARPHRVVALLVPGQVPAASTMVEAVAALRDVLLALPGVTHADVQARPFLGREEAWLTVAPDEGATPSGRAWARLLARTEAAALQALAGLDRRPVPEPGPATGFAEAAPALAEARRPRGRPRRDAARTDVAAPADALALLEQLAFQASSPDPAPMSVPTPAPARQGWSDQALLARLLALAGRREDDHAGLAARLLERHGSFAGVLALPVRELLAEPGVNRHLAANIKLVHATALRFARAEVAQAPVLDDQAALLAYLTAVLARERIEQFRILFLDAGHRLLSDEAQARGTVNHTPVYPREVAKRALELHASSLILVHNHPSGDPSPSREDLGMTEQVRRALGVVDVALEDHLIVGAGRHFSFRAAGLLTGG